MTQFQTDKKFRKAGMLKTDESKQQKNKMDNYKAPGKMTMLLHLFF
jgi:hypothetical protein